MLRFLDVLKSRGAWYIPESIRNLIPSTLAVSRKFKRFTNDSPDKNAQCKLPFKFNGVLRQECITDTDPDMLGQTALINRLGAPVDNYYKLMVNNFLAEVPRFFLKKKKFSTFRSRKQGDPKFGNIPDDSKLYGMRVKIRRTMKNPRYRHVATGTNTDPASGSIMLPQDRAADPTLTDNVERVQENFTMYSRVSAFGPPCAGIGPNSKYSRD